MKSRTLKAKLKSELLNMGGTLVKQPLPTNGVRRISPFLLLHHFGPTTVPPGKDPLGVGAHPHRGFEPVTFLFSGGIQHKDSKGNRGNLGPGDVQWMTAGSGIVHSELATPEFLASGGTMEGIQLWVNLSKSNKMVEPSYQDISKEAIPVLEEGLAQIKVVAGSYKTLEGPAKTHSPILALIVDLENESNAQIPIPEGFNSLLYIINGGVQLEDGSIHEKENMLQFNNDGQGVSLKANTKSRLLLLAGEAIDEPLAQYGPFVMNNQQELAEAIQDYQLGKMGHIS